MAQAQFLPHPNDAVNDTGLIEMRSQVSSVVKLSEQVEVFIYTVEVYMVTSMALI